MPQRCCSARAACGGSAEARAERRSLADTETATGLPACPSLSAPKHCATRRAKHTAHCAQWATLQQLFTPWAFQAPVCLVIIPHMEGVTVGWLLVLLSACCPRPGQPLASISSATLASISTIAAMQGPGAASPSLAPTRAAFAANEHLRLLSAVEGSGKVQHVPGKHRLLQVFQSPEDTHCVIFAVGTAPGAGAGAGVGVAAAKGEPEAVLDRVLADLAHGHRDGSQPHFTAAVRYRYPFISAAAVRVSAAALAALAADTAVTHLELDAAVGVLEGGEVLDGDWGGAVVDDLPVAANASNALLDGMDIASVLPVRLGAVAC